MATSGGEDPRINEEIDAHQVRLVGPDGGQVGITSIAKALAMARDMEMDLVEVASQASPPVCRVMDYGKFKFDEAQKAKESRRRSSHSTIKEMKYRPKIGEGDFDTKTRQVAKFLDDGHKVKVTIMFRGREVNHPEIGMKILDRIAEHVDGSSKIEATPRLDGRNMTMVLAPAPVARKIGTVKTIDGLPEGEQAIDATQVSGSISNLEDGSSAASGASTQG